VTWWLVITATLAVMSLAITLVIIPEWYWRWELRRLRKDRP
jgi:hypothetical protein